MSRIELFKAITEITNPESGDPVPDDDLIAVFIAIGAMRGLSIADLTSDD